MDDSKGVKGWIEAMHCLHERGKGRREKKVRHKQKRCRFSVYIPCTGGDANSMVGRRILDEAELS